MDVARKYQILLNYCFIETDKIKINLLFTSLYFTIISNYYNSQ